VDPGLLKPATIRRRGSLHSTRDVALLIDLLPQLTATERVPCTLVVNTRYVERVATCVRFDLEVARWFLLPRLDLDRLAACRAYTSLKDRRPNGKVLRCDASCIER
jgi:hypothetical protein